MFLRLFGAGFVMAAMAVLLASGQQETRLRTTTHGVRIDALVSDSGGPVLGLHSEDFEILDKGVPQRLDAAEAAGHVAVALTIDTSLGARATSMRTYMYEMPPESFSSILRACDVLLGALGPGDLAALVAVADRVVPLVPLTRDATAWRQGLVQMQGLPARAAPLATDGRGTIAFANETDGLMPQLSAWDGALAAASLVARDSGRSLVVLVSDGIDDASWLSLEAVSRTLADLGIAVDFVQTSKRRFHYGVATPEDLAKKTGGIVYNTDDSKLPEKFRERLAYLRQSYVLTYEPRGVATNDGWHDLVVKVKGRNVTVRARPGYYANRPVK
ncbi:MAG TPA: VWA domain-containing protein [Vicinamibacterales bacterium]|nr:VWA domain-containing protein [Vicinamibacterales bacterium]